MSPMLTAILNKYLDSLMFDAVENPHPYLFHSKGDTTRCVVSSLWCSQVKGVFKRHSGKAATPKSLRVSWRSESNPALRRALLLTMGGALWFHRRRL